MQFLESDKRVVIYTGLTGNHGAVLSTNMTG